MKNQTISGLVWLILVLLYSAICMSQPASDKNLLLVADKAEDAVYFVNTDTLEVESRVEVGRGPHEIIIVPGLGRAYVTNYEGSPSVSIIDINSRREIYRSSLRRMDRPHGIVPSHDGKWLYITIEANLAVLQMDPRNGEPLQTIETGQRITHMIVASPDGSRLYTSNLGSGNVSVIDLSSKSVIKQIATGNGTEGIALTPDGKELWVTNRASDSISIIDSDLLDVIETFEVTGFPIRVEISPDNHFAVISSAEAGQVTIVDVATRQQMAQLKVGNFPVGIEITPDSKWAYIGNSRSGTVSVVDLLNSRVSGEIKVGQGPDGMAFISQ
jgi:YVTN family beta-propeller protein